MLVEKPGPLPNSEHQALKRFYSIHKKMEKDPKFKADYIATFEHDEKAGFIRKLSSEEAIALRKNPQHWIIPHFGVYHPDKPDKCRRVLDSAAKNQGVSLNTILDSGPNILNPLLGVIVRFRFGRYAVNADIDKILQPSSSAGRSAISHGLSVVTYSDFEARRLRQHSSCVWCCLRSSSSHLCSPQNCRTISRSWQHYHTLFLHGRFLP